MSEDLRRAILYGMPCGALASLIFREGTLWLLHYVAKVMPLAALITTPGWHGLPWVAWFMVLGAAGGFFIALFLRLIFLPDLICGAVLGLAAGFLVPQYLPRSTPDWVPWLTGAAWGWGTAFLLRPLALRGRF
ncbi:hypothetical protein [Muricoccus radiodurans]|uniref:hypothetical protein n=1 Tax=Muricoccus radiodurans TaxID=2231721 RepID=UPI003CF94B5A